MNELMNTNIISNAINELYRIYDMINYSCFADSLPHPVITMYPTKGKMIGHFTKDKVWQNKDQVAGTDSGETTDAFYELNIDPRWFNDHDVFEIVHTLIHEMCHFANRIAGIEDCKGKSHTKDFKRTAESAGLIVNKQRGIGYGDTSLSDDLANFIESSVLPDEDVFKYFRVIVTEEKKKPKKKNLFEYTCPSCGMVAKAKQDAKIICGMCNVELEMEEIDEDTEDEIIESSEE